jgi:putative phosphoribosyl transferase
MYFSSRMQAGRMLANQLADKHTGEDCVVLALGDGAVRVGFQIAIRLKCNLMMLMSAQIDLPREDVAVGGITEGGSFSYNSAYSPGEIDEFVGEYRSLIEQEKLERLHELNRAGKNNGLIDKELLRCKNIILVSDGLNNGFILDLAAEYLKTIEIKKLIVATPLANVPAVDRIHIVADEIYCLSVVADYISTEHYYELEDIPTHEEAAGMIKTVMDHWK